MNTLEELSIEMHEIDDQNNPDLVISTVDEIHGSSDNDSDLPFRVLNNDVDMVASTTQNESDLPASVVYYVTPFL